MCFYFKHRKKQSSKNKKNDQKQDETPTVVPQYVPGITTQQQWPVKYIQVQVDLEKL